MPRLLRDAPLNSIWEGSGNVMALDVLRAAGARARGAAGLPGRVRAGPRRRPAARRPPATRAGRRSTSRPRAARAAVVERPRAGLPGARCSSATRRRPWPTPSAPAGSAGARARVTARCRPASTLRRSSRGTRRPCSGAMRSVRPPAGGTRLRRRARRRQRLRLMVASGTPQSVKRPTSSSSSLGGARQLLGGGRDLLGRGARLLRGGRDLLGRRGGLLGDARDLDDVVGDVLASPSAICSTAAAISLTRAETTSTARGDAGEGVARLGDVVDARPRSRSAPVSTTVDGALGLGLDLVDQLGDRLGGRLGLLGELADLVGHDGEAAALLAGAGGLDGGVERQQVGLLGDAGDGVDDAADALALGAQLADGLAGLGRGVADGGHGLGRRARRSRCRRRAAARASSAAREVSCASWAEAVVAPATCSVVARAEVDGAHLALGAGGDVADGAGDLLDRAARIGRRRRDELRGAGHARWPSATSGSPRCADRPRGRRRRRRGGRARSAATRRRSGRPRRRGRRRRPAHGGDRPSRRGRRRCGRPRRGP